jgi:hypothetical protein
VQTFFSIDTEVAHRRLEWERALVAAEQRDLARPKNGPKRWSHVVSQTLAYLRSLATPRVPVTCWNTPGTPRARSLHVEGGCATAT